jgi:hypothetical protein
VESAMSKGPGVGGGGGGEAETPVWLGHLESWDSSWGAGVAGPEWSGQSSGVV